MIIDDLDRRILKSIPDEKPARVIDIIRPFFKEKSQRALRERLKKLHYLGYIELQKQAFGILVKTIERKPGHSNLEGIKNALET